MLFANWDNGQPDDYGDGQDVATMFGGLVTFPVTAGRWDDGGRDGGIGGGISERVGYLVKYDAVGAVPEPGSLLLLGAGFLGLRARRWRRA